MLLTYARLREQYPPVEPLRVELTAGERRLARLDRPPALPHHCKPWMDARRLGFMLRYPYEATLRVRAASDGAIAFSYDSHGTAASAGVAVSTFAASHFSMRAGYRFRTPRPFSLMTLPLPDAPSIRPRVVTGIVETWWYPRPLFIVFENPTPGEELVLSYGEPVCALVPVVLGHVEAREMTSEEAACCSDEDERYRQESDAMAGMSWASLEGVGFSRRYKFFSNRAARSPMSPTAEQTR